MSENPGWAEKRDSSSSGGRRGGRPGTAPGSPAMKRPRTRFRPLLGPLVALAVIGAVEALSWTPFRIPNAPAIILLAVVFSAFVSGLWPGLFAAGAGWAYFAYFFSIHGQSGQLFVYSVDDFRRVVIWAFATPIMALMVGVLKRRAEVLAREQGAQAEARKSIEELQHYGEIVKHMPGGLYVYHLEEPGDDRTLRLVAANPASARLTGVAVEGVLQKTLDENFPGLRARSIPQRFAEVVRTGRAAEFEDLDYGDARVARAAWSFRAFPLLGNSVGVAFEDITKRKQAEAALLKSERQLSLIYSNVSDILYYLAVEPDDRFRFLGVNPSFSKATGLAESQVVGKLVQETIPEPSLALVLGNYKEAIRDKKTVRWVEVSVYPTGTKHGEVSVTPIFDANGHCTNLVGTVHDITERKQMEEALVRSESMAAVGRLSSQVAHEINNPLTALLGYLERIKTKVRNDPKAAEAAERVERAAHRIRDLARGLLSLARASRMEMGPVRLPALLDESRKMLEPDLEKHGVRVEWKVPGSLPEIRGSGEHLLQAFSNMLINARQAMASGGMLTVEAAASDGEVRVSVADTGVGIPPENMQRIFEPFFTTKAKGEGTGLGLSICQSVVAQHGGRIEVASEVGRGSTFTVILPAGRDEAHRSGGPVILPAGRDGGGAQ